MDREQTDFSRRPNIDSVPGKNIEREESKIIESRIALHNNLKTTALCGSSNGLLLKSNEAHAFQSDGHKRRARNEEGEGRREIIKDSKRDWDETEEMEISDILSSTFAQYLHTVSRHESCTFNGRSSVYTMSMSTDISRATGKHSDLKISPINYHENNHFNCSEKSFELRSPSVSAPRTCAQQSSFKNHTLPLDNENALGSSDYKRTMSNPRTYRDEHVYTTSVGRVPPKNELTSSSLSSTLSLDSLLGIDIEGDCRVSSISNGKM